MGIQLAHVEEVPRFSLLFFRAYWGKRAIWPVGILSIE